MRQPEDLRQQVKEEIERVAGPVLTIRGETDLQALNTLVRALGSNPLLASHLGSGSGALQIQVMPGNYEGCGCRAETDSGAASAVRPAAPRISMVPAFAGLLTLARIQGANLPKGSSILLDQDAVITPQVRDWLRQNNIQVQRNES